MVTKLLGLINKALTRSERKSKKEYTAISESYLKANYVTDVSELDMERYRNAIKGNISKLRRKTKGTDEADAMAMERVEQSFIDEFGFPDRFVRVMRLKNELAQLRYEYIVENKRINLNFIKQKERQIENEEDKMKGGLDIMQAKTVLDKWLGTILKLSEITVLDFYTKLKEYERNS